MAQFEIASSGTVELGGPLSELIGQPVALRPDSTDLVHINTEFGKSPALRVHTINLATGEYEGIRLLFWQSMQKAVLASNAKGFWAVGRIEQVAQEKHPDRSVYVLSNPGIPNDAIGAAIDAYESTVYVTT